MTTNAPSGWTFRLLYILFGMDLGGGPKVKPQKFVITIIYFLYSLYAVILLTKVLLILSFR